ncbi:MAG: hypothetical protein K2X55_12315 [Burkholderiaceae bacterium]|nr:hypothetical protein [Burkholderiaceae bacterium]
MSNELITRLGEAAAKAARRAIENGERAGNDQNRGQFVAMMSNVLNDVPSELRGDEANDFLKYYANGAYAAPARPR